MFSIKYVLILIVILIILCLLYYSNKKLTNVRQAGEANKTSETSDVDQTRNVNSMKLGVYYTDWCGISRDFLNQLQDGLSQSIEDAGANIVLVDCEKNKDVCDAMDIRGYPSLILHTDKGNIIYNGQRDERSIVNFINSVKSN